MVSASIVTPHKLRLVRCVIFALNASAIVYLAEKTKGLQPKVREQRSGQLLPYRAANAMPSRVLFLRMRVSKGHEALHKACIASLSNTVSDRCSVHRFGHFAVAKH